MSRHILRLCVLIYVYNVANVNDAVPYKQISHGSDRTENNKKSAVK